MAERTPLVCAAFFWVSETAVRPLLIIASFVSAIVELFNTAVEAAVDHTSTEKHELAKLAKDAGSAAQLFAMLMLAAVWLVPPCSQNACSRICNPLGQYVVFIIHLIRYKIKHIPRLIL